MRSANVRDRPSTDDCNCAADRGLRVLRQFVACDTQRFGDFAAGAARVSPSTTFGGPAAGLVRMADLSLRAPAIVLS